MFGISDIDTNSIFPVDKTIRDFQMDTAKSLGMKDAEIYDNSCHIEFIENNHVVISNLLKQMIKSFKEWRNDPDDYWEAKQKWKDDRQKLIEEIKLFKLNN